MVSFFFKKKAIIIVAMRVFFLKKYFLKKNSPAPAQGNKPSPVDIHGTFSSTAPSQIPSCEHAAAGTRGGSPTRRASSSQAPLLSRHHGDEVASVIWLRAIFHGYNFFFVL
jgi:hypothetical protein